MLKVNENQDNQKINTVLLRKEDELQFLNSVIQKQHILNENNSQQCNQAFV